MPSFMAMAFGGLEADAADVARQAIRVLGHDLDGVGPINLENPYRSRSADAVAVQEHHDLADRLLLGPGGDDASSANRPDAVNLAKPVRVASMKSNAFSPKARTSFLA